MEVSVCTWWLHDHLLWECVVATNWLFVNKPCPDSEHVGVSEGREVIDVPSMNIPIHQPKIESVLWDVQ